jgi:Flp pilus assembly protein protease CpaA
MPDEIQLLRLLPAIYLGATLIIAALIDLVSHRIPNRLLAPALAVAILSNLVFLGAGGLLTSLAGLAAGLAMLMPLYVMGAMGAGDVKLLGVAGAFLGPVGALLAGLATYIAGALYGVLWIAYQRLRPEAEAPDVNLWFPELAAVLPGFALWLGKFSSGSGDSGSVATTYSNSNKSTFAYAPAIAVGVLFTMWYQGWPASVMPG